jgi:thiol-disulfide isomerase/thioredoxin
MIMPMIAKVGLLLTCYCLAFIARAADLEVLPGPVVHPPFELEGLDGGHHSLGDYRGKVVVINFWASWCVPCLREMPSLQRLAEKFSDRPFEIVTINVAEPRNVVAASRERMKLDCTILLDPEKATMNAWGVKVLPTSYLLDPEGRIRYQAVGPVDWETDAVYNAVEALLPPAEINKGRQLLLPPFL